MKAARATTLALITLPLVLAATETVYFKVRNYDAHALRIHGVTRRYSLHVPRRLDRSRPVPLVITLHGAGGWGSLMERLSEWDRIADADDGGFIAAYPTGIEGRGPITWHDDVDAPLLTNDTSFMVALIDTLVAEYHVDRARVYVSGFSNGGGMSWLLSCLINNRVAAFGLVGAALTMDTHVCPDHRPVPGIIFHGTADAAGPYDGGPSWVSPNDMPFGSIPLLVSDWAKRNGCGAARDSSVTRTVVLRTYAKCPAGAEIAFYTIVGGGHTWPGTPVASTGNGNTTKEITANTLMWQFFQRFQLPA